MRCPDIASITAVILAGGLGTRLRSAVGDRPKVLAPVAGRPFLHHVLASLSRSGLVRVVLCTGYGAEQVRECCGDGSRWGLDLRYSQEPEPLGTGGAVKHAEPLIASDPFLVLNGDTLVRSEPTPLVRFHIEHPARITLGLVEVADRERFGSVELAGDGSIVAFCEKGRRGPGLVNAGVYVVDRAVLNSIPSGACISIEQEVFPRLIDKGIYGALVPGPLIDIGTPEAYALAQEALGEAICVVGKKRSANN